MDEEEIYRRYTNRETLTGERRDIGLKGVKIRVKYLNNLVERYLALW